MKFDFQRLFPVFQQEFNAVTDHYPTDLSHLVAQIPVGGDSFVRKQRLVELAANHCPVHIFDHFPFAFELDIGSRRDRSFHSYFGGLCKERSGVDFTPFYTLRTVMNEYNLGTSNGFADFLHRTMDHDKLLRVGFRGVYEECVQRNASETDPEKHRYRELVKACCRAVETVGLRLREEARARLECAQDETVRYQLQRILNSPNTPWEPAQSYYDALNSILCGAMFISSMDGLDAYSLGQVDRLVEPFYQADLAAGQLTEEEAYYLMQCFLYKQDLHSNYDATHTCYDNGVTVAVGGVDLQGNPIYNPITKMILRVFREHRLLNPKLNARACKDSPPEYFRELARIVRSGHNNLVVQNDDYIVPMFCKMGLSPEDARTYIGNGCQEVICRNQTHHRAFTYVNMVQILLDTIRYNVQTLPEPLQKIYRYGSFQKDSYPDLENAFLTNLRSCFRTITECYAPYELQHLQINPEPLLSAFTADCIASGKDLASGGARYRHKTLSLVGFGTLCDSLLSLRRAYENGTQEALFAAMETDFADQEPYRLQLQNSTDRFGHSEQADAFARALSHTLAGCMEGITDGQGLQWHTSLFTYSLFRPFGEKCGATPDGRHAGDYLSRQMNMAKLPDLTTAARSMAVLTEAPFHDVGMFDIAMPLTVTDTEQALQAMADYIRTCVCLKIPVLQPNVTDLSALQEERAHKGTHPSLIVRVCGYSAYFTHLQPVQQDEIISRLQR